MLAVIPHPTGNTCLGVVSVASRNLFRLLWILIAPQRSAATLLKAWTLASWWILLYYRASAFLQPQLYSGEATIWCKFTSILRGWCLFKQFAARTLPMISLIAIIGRMRLLNIRGYVCIVPVQYILYHYTLGFTIVYVAWFLFILLHAPCMLSYVFN